MAPFEPSAQEGDDRGLPPLPGVLERRDPVPVGDRPVGAGGQQRPDHRLVARSAVAEDHRLEQRGPAEVVDVCLLYTSPSPRD